MRMIGIILVALAALVGILAWGPGALETTRFAPPPADPAIETLFDRPTTPLRRERADLFGAEDLEAGPDGRLYASLADGRIMARTPGRDGTWSEVGNTGGRPLGLAFAPDGRLFVADARRGLLAQTPDGWETWLASTEEGGPLVFADDLTVLRDGRIVLTDASLRHGYGHHLESFFTGDQTGRILMVTAPGEYETLADGLAFINGVDHDPQTGRVYVNETWSGRIWQLDPESGNMHILVEGLPGYPDNLEFDTDTGLIWSALPSRRAADLEALHPHPFLKRLVWRWIQLTGFPPLPPRPAMAIAVDTDGTPVLALLGPEEDADGITSVIVWDGEIWTSGLARDGMTVFALPARD